MKNLLDLGVLSLLSLVSVIFTQSSLARFSFLSTQDSPLTKDTFLSDPRDDVLSQALSKALPPLFQHNLAHASALDIFRSLESKPSCHRSAAASLVLDCSALDGQKAQDGGVKITYAAQLAVCEFKAAGISFPQECKGLDDGKWLEMRIMKCVKKLEERPQWWTTLSNNIQSVAVMCSAIRNEIEKGRISSSKNLKKPSLTRSSVDQLLALHKNITKTQKSLLEALETSLGESWESIEAQKEFTSTWRRILDSILGELIEVGGGAADAIKAIRTDSVDTIKRFAQELEITRKGNQEAVILMDQLIHRARNGVESLEERSKVVIEGTGRVVEDLTSGVKTQHGVIKRNSDIVEQVNSLLSSEVVSSIDDLLRAVDVLSFKIRDSLIRLEELEETSESYSLSLASLSVSYRNLTRYHIALAASLNEQENSQQKLLSSLEIAHHSANTTFESLLKGMNILTHSLGDIDARVRSWKMNEKGQPWMPLGAVILSFGILIGREGGKVVLILIGTFTGVIFVLVGSLYYSDLTEVLNLEPSVMVGISSKDTKNLTRLPGLVVWTGVVFGFALVVVTILFFAFRRRRRCLANTH